MDLIRVVVANMNNAHDISAGTEQKQSPYPVHSPFVFTSSNLLLQLFLKKNLLLQPVSECPFCSVKG